MKISVKFYNQPVIEIAVDDTETGRLYFDLSRQQNSQQAPYYRDTLMYTPEYMVELAREAQQVFGWNWLSEQYDTSITTQLHKDLENSVASMEYENIPEQYDQLVYDLHHCLHAIQFGKTTPGRWDNFQIEWLTDNSVPLPSSFEFKESSKYGDLTLINPYVGHNPLQIYRENDFACLATTCKFHDVIKPGIVLTHAENISKDQILAEFVKQDPAFVQLHGLDKIRYYAGSAVIGHVMDTAILTQVKQAPSTLVIDRVDFYE